MTVFETASDPNSPVLFELRGSGVAVVTLNRPERMNAWGGGLAAAFYRCMDRAEADPRSGSSCSRAMAAHSVPAPTWVTWTRSGAPTPAGTPT